MVRLDDVGPGPHPVLAVGAGQLVEVDNDVPSRGVGAVAVQGGAAPESAGVGGVAPEVVEVLTAAAYVGNAAVGVEHFQGFGAHPLEQFAAQFGGGGVIAGPHPIQGALVVDVLQPQIRVLHHARHSRCRAAVNSVV